jgi:ParB family transcriptional regulator, chromosome partitioning protein
MSKLEELLKATGANIDASMGAGRAARPLHGATPTAGASSGRMAGLVRSKDAAEIPLDRIVRDPGQPREEFDEEALARLAQSLRTRGQLQPIRVRWSEEQGAYVVLVGERRWRAARMAGMAALSCVIADSPMTAEEVLAIQMIENALREDLTGMEQAKAYRSLIEANGWSARQLAGELAINPATVTRALALLELPDAVQEQVEQGGLSPAAAYEVSKLERSEDQVAVAQAAVEQGLRRSEVAELAQAVKARRPSPAARPSPVEFDLGDGTMVRISWKKANSTGPTQALRKALKASQERERRDESDAA